MMKLNQISRTIAFLMVSVMTFTSIDTYAAVRAEESFYVIEEADEDVSADVSDGVDEAETIDEADGVYEADGVDEAEIIDEPENLSVSDNSISPDGDAYGLANPRTDSHGTVTWDCVYFGTYPQAEVVADKSAYTAIGSDYLSSGDVIESSGLYNTLQSATFNDKGFATVTYGGSTFTYKRIKKGNATYGTSGSSSHYNWSDSTTWHYFRCDPIKWRVLSVNGSDAFLLADKGLDHQRYNTSYTSSITWEKSTIRSWLNGYGSTVNTEGTDYSSNGDNFIDTAFTSGEQGAIKTTSVVNADNTYNGTDGGNDTSDKVFLLSESEVYSASNGFSSDYSTFDKCRISKSSTYAKAMGVCWDPTDDYKGNCYWWLRSPGTYSHGAAHVYPCGIVDRGGYGVNDNDDAARPALYINLSSNLHTLAGTVDSNRVVVESVEPEVKLNTSTLTVAKNTSETLTATAKDETGKTDENPDLAWESSDEDVATVEDGVVTGVAEGEATITVTYKGKSDECEVTVIEGYGLKNPRKDKLGTVTWDCIYFGTYPQAEVIPDMGAYTAIDKDILTSGDIIESSGLYSKLQGASFDDKGFAKVTYIGKTYTYKRIKQKDAVNGVDYLYDYKWSDAITYHYFRCEPIKWRVLSVNGDDAFVLADKGLDNQLYNTSLTSITWEKSTIRSWLNGYGSSMNNYGTDYRSNNFVDVAFTSDEKGALKTTSVINSDNVHYGTDGGNDTEDKVFLLSESEACNTSYGFSSDYENKDSCRIITCSTYVKAMGTSWGIKEEDKGECWWRLRTPGSSSDNVEFIRWGDVDRTGFVVTYGDYAIRPAMHINLSSNLWKSAGAFSSENSCAIKLNTVSANIIRGNTETLTVTVYDKNGERVEFPELIWSSSDESVAKVEDGVVTGISPGQTTITVSYQGKTAECEVTVTTGYGLRNPQRNEDGVVTWDCVYFGTYPQAEVVADKSDYIGTYSRQLAAGDLIVSAGLYRKLKNESFDDKDLATVTYNGSTYTYKRIKRPDFIFGKPEYIWSDEDPYNYFRCEPIKWRVLSVDGSDAFLLSDKGLDDQEYNTSDIDITWEKSTIRSWLNGYGSTSNSDGIDYSTNNFIDMAFSSKEKGAIWTTCVINADIANYGINSGNDTKDKIFLLSESEATNTSFGFASDPFERDEGRISVESTYSNAMACYTGDGGGRIWCLRSPGYYAPNEAVCVSGRGECQSGFAEMYYDVRPALHVDLSSNLWKAAGKVSSEHMVCYQNVELNTVSLSILKNKSETLSVTAYDMNGMLDNNPELAWSSLDESVAVVEEGEVTGISPGQTVITVTYQGETAECEVTVVSDYGLKDPRKNSDGVVTWDCIYFGTYPQAEVVADKSAYSAIGSDYLSSGDVIESSGLYNTLQSATFNDKGFATVTYGGSTFTYKRIKKGNATYTYSSSDYYNWSDSTTYHYFRCEPIKWRVLSVSGNDAFLLADKGLDDQRYNTSYTSITWEKSTIRSWLNGYGSTVNAEGTDYSSNGDNFIDTAFTSGEKGAIKTTSVINADNTYYGTEGGNDTSDKVFLLSLSEVSSTSNGFSSDYSTYDKCRRSKSSTYAKAMGTWWKTSDDYRGNCYWWLRSPGDYFKYDYAVIVGYGGYLDNHCGCVYDSYAARPALHINLSSNRWESAGKVNSEGTEYEPKIELNTVSANVLRDGNVVLTATAYDKYGEIDENPELIWSSSDESVAVVESGVVFGISLGQATITVTYQGKTAECEVTVVVGHGIKNPRKNSDGVVTWDCIYFGTYPQAEVVADKSAYTAIDKDILGSGDIIEDSGLYSELQSASFNDKGVATVTYGGSTFTYKRIKKADATYSSGRSSYRYGHYKWSDATTYHYFRCEPIKWRVLSVGASDAFLVADKGLDDQMYNKARNSITWESSTIRSWLNGYGSTVNTEGTDYSSNGDNFIDTAFTSGEKGAIKTTSVVNADNTYYGTDGGNSTSDKVFLLSESDVYSTSNGFSADYSTDDKCRRSKSSTYAKAMGARWITADDYKGNCYWWLRSPGGVSYNAATVYSNGNVNRGGNNVDYDINAARPALHINLSSNLWESAGKVNSEGTEYEPKIELNTVSANIIQSDTETLSVTAYDKYGEIDENPELTWSSSEKSVATVEEGVVTGISPGQATITVTYQGKTAECVVTVAPDYKLRNPRRNDEGVVTWDCVSFGSYPQAEVVPDKSTYTAIDGNYLKEGDLIEDANLYAKLQNASFDSKNLATVTYNGRTYKYKRIKKADATYSTSGSEVYYNWPDETTYHYFRCEPIKWRVLSVDGSDAFLLADKGLDNQKYNEARKSLTWENSTIRSWLNGYGSAANGDGVDFSANNFMDSAFTLREKSAIKTTSVENADNIYYGTDGGNDTEDKIFLLSESEAANTKFGFEEVSTLPDKGRQNRGTIYAKAMGLFSTHATPYIGNCNWWLRTPGINLRFASVISFNGPERRNGYYLYSDRYAVRPALHIDLSSEYWKLAGMVNSQGVVYEPKIELNTVSANIIQSDTETLSVTAYDKYGEIDENPELTWSSSDKSIATVEEGVVTGISLGQATITVTYQGKMAECVVTVIEAEPEWHNSCDEVSGTTYTLNLAVKQKYSVEDFKKVRGISPYNITESKADKKIATLSSKGIITAKKEGKATIVLKKGNKTYTITVNVYDPKFSAKIYTMNVDETKVLDYVHCGLKPSFSIPDKQQDKATVSTLYTGVPSVTAKKCGTVTITATVGEGKEARKTTAKIRIYNPTLKFYKDRMKVKVGKTLKVSVKNGAKGTVWTSSDDKIATVKNGRIKGRAPGTVWIIAVNNGKELKQKIIVE